MGNIGIEKRMLLIVDPQVDFINGTLPVPGAEKAIDALGNYVSLNGKEYSTIIVTCDRHSMRHCSFADYGGQWPRHCVEASVGAAIWPSLMDALLQHADITHILYKGEDPSKDEYSIFQNTKGADFLTNIITNAGITDIDICGLAGDVCVAATLTDAQNLYKDIHFNLLQPFTAYIQCSRCEH